MKILIADDHELIIEGFSILLKQLPSIEEVDAVQFKNDLLEKLKIKKYDILFQDIKFGADDARDFVPQVIKQYPKMKIIILSSLSDKFVYESLFKQGVNGYVVKSSPKSTIYEAIKKVQDGHIYISEELMRTNNESRINTDTVLITDREKKILQLIMNEMTIKEIANFLFLSEKTVEMHRTSLFRKFEAKNLAGLVKKAILEGYL